ncbi:MAG: autotransporter domain-containing protein [Parachlamydiaceae bacterium]
MIKFTFHSIFPLSLMLTLASITAFCLPLFADQYWDGSTTSGSNPPAGGSGNWNTSTTNWTLFGGGTHAAWLGTEPGFFTGTPGVVTLNQGSPINIVDLHFDVDGYSVVPNGASDGLQLNDTFVHLFTNVGVAATISSNLTGIANQSIFKTGAGKLSLSGMNQFQQTVVVDEGTLVIAPGGQTTTGSGSGATVWVGNNNSDAVLVVKGVLNDYSSVIGVGPGTANNTAIVTGEWNHNTGGLDIGSYSSGNALKIVAGGKVTSNDSVRIGLYAEDAENSVLVNGADSSLTINNSLVVGLGGDHNALSITEGAQLSNHATSIGEASTSNNNRVWVSDPLTVWNGIGSFQLGSSGSENTLTVRNQATVNISSGDVVVGYGAGNDSNGNVMTVTGAGTSFNIGSGKTLYVGGARSDGTAVNDQNGSFNSLVISDGAAVHVNKNGRIGGNTQSNFNTVTVTGENALWTSSGTVRVGSFGSHNALNIVEGGEVVVGTKLSIGHFLGANDNTVLVKGEGSTLTADAVLVGVEADNNSLSVADLAVLNVMNQPLVIGSEGSENVLSITGGGRVSNQGTFIGGAFTSNSNRVWVSDSLTVWDASGDFQLGVSGNENVLTVQNGATVNLISGDMWVGYGAEGQSNRNLMTVTGGGTSFNITGENTFYIGGERSDDTPISDQNGSFNSLMISDGASVNVNGSSRIGANTASNFNRVTVTGKNTVWNTIEHIRVGSFGSYNELDILKGGKVWAGAELAIGYFSGADHNQVLVEGEGSTLIADSVSISNQLTPVCSIDCPATNRGNTLTVANEGSINAQSGIVIAPRQGAEGTLIIGKGGAPGYLKTPIVVGGITLPSNNAELMVAEQLLIKSLQSSLKRANGLSTFSYSDDAPVEANVMFDHNATSYLFSPRLFGRLNVLHQGTGTTIFTANNLYEGTTTIDHGLLKGGAINVFSPLSPLIVNRDGGFDLGGFNQSVGRITNGGLLKFGKKHPGVVLTVNGDYVQTASGRWVERINRAGQSDVIAAKGAAVLDGTLKVMAKDGYEVFKKYHLLHADGLIKGAFSHVVVDNPLIKERVDYHRHHAYISFKPNLSGVACSKNERHVATQIDHITDPSSDLQNVLSVLVNSPVHDVCDTLDAFSGEQYPYLNQLARYHDERLNSTIFDAMRATLNPCACSDRCDPIQTWCQLEKGQCFAGHQGKRHGLSAVNVDCNVGVLSSLSDTLIVGAAGQYAYSDIDFPKHSDGHTHWNTGEMALFGAYHQGAFYGFANAMGGQSWGAIERRIDFQTIHRKAKGSARITQGLLYIETGVDVCWCNLLFQPFIGLECGVYRQNKMKEKKAGSLNLELESQTTHTFDSYLGAHFTSTLNCFTLQADMAWQHRYHDGYFENRMKFIEFGHGFNVKSVAFGHDALRGALSFSTNLCDNIRCFVEIAGEKWKRWSAYDANIGVSVEW